MSTQILSLSPIPVPGRADSSALKGYTQSWLSPAFVQVVSNLESPVHPKAPPPTKAHVPQRATGCLREGRVWVCCVEPRNQSLEAVRA